jgi:serine/threonine-protein kinase RsbW
VAVASLAAELPFTLQDIEDVRIAVDELSAVAIDGCDDEARLDLRFEILDGRLVVSGRVPGAGEPPPIHAVAVDLLGLVAEGHELGVDGGDRVFRFEKRPPQGP